MSMSTHARSGSTRRFMFAAVTAVATASVLLVPSAGATAATAAAPEVTTPAIAAQAVSCAHSPAKKATKTSKGVKAVTMCLAVGGPAGKRTWTRYDGSSWTKAKSIAHVGSSVSCVTPTFCVAVGDSAAAVYNGRAWSAPKSVVPSSESLSSVSCSKTTSCVGAGSSASGGAIATAYDGKRWAKPISIDQGAQFAPAVSCSPSVCMAVEGNSIAIERAGKWSLTHNDDAIQLTAVSCVGSSRCVLTDLYGEALVWNGRSYTPVTVSRGSAGFAPLDAVSCSTSTSCVIGGSNDPQSAPQLWTLTGTSLAKPTSPKTARGTNTVMGLDCLTSTFCGVAAEQADQQ